MKGTTDNTITFAAADPHTVCFHNSQGEKTGELDFSGAEIKFTGEADESAQVFMKAMGRDLSEVFSAARALVAQIDVVNNDPEYLSVWVLYDIRAGNYTGCNFVDELDALRKALK